MGLLNVYENMIAAQQETEKVAQVTEAVDERLQVIEKYASLADDMLTKEYGNDYNEDDVVKLAQLLIEHDSNLQQEVEKVAELHEAGIIMAKAFKAELARD